MFRPFTRGSGWVVSLLLMLAASASAQDLRIESKVFLPDGGAPHENLTQLHQGVVYDYLTQPPEVTIFDPSSQRFIMLDSTRKMKSEIKLEKVESFAEQLRERASQDENPMLQFLANPQFQQQYAAAREEMVFDSPYLNYRLTTIKAPTQVIAQQYAVFASAYAKLNALTNPGSMPPQARLAINEALLKHQRLPADVKLTMLFRKQIQVRSEHKVHFRLLDEDMKMIRQTDEMFAKYKSVELGEYMTAERPTEE